MRPAFLIGIVASAGALAVAFSWQRCAAASEEAQSARAHFTSVEAQASEILSLRAERARVESGARPPQDLIARVSSALAEVGVPSDRLQSLERATDEAIGDGRLRRQSTALALAALRPREIGSFLARWRSDHPAWVATQIELLHPRSAAADSEAFEARIRLAATYLAEPEEGRSR